MSRDEVARRIALKSVHDRYDYWNNEFSYEKDPRYKGKIGHIYVTKVTKAQGGAKKGAKKAARRK